MTRSRLTMTVDEEAHMLILRYIGAIEGDEINLSMIEQLSRLDAPWTYDTIIDMRRYDNTVLASEIDELGMKWGMLAQGRDKGRLTAIVSEDPLVWARLPISQAAFPHRILQTFKTYDEGMDWIRAGREAAHQAVA